MTIHRAIFLPSVRPTRSRIRFLLALTALLAMVGSIGIGTAIPAYANDPACGPLAGGIHQVSTVAHLKAVGSGGAGSGECGLGAAYFQVNDLDVSGESSWTGIGTSAAPFTGEYNGNFMRITGGRVWGDTFYGFFAHVGQSGTVRDLGVSNIRVSVSTTLGSQSDGRGLLVGENRGTLTNTFATGVITTGDWFVGGLAGYSTGTIRQSFASVTISGSSTTAQYVGGLVGLLGTNGLEEQGIISDSYSRGSVSGQQYVGGLAGQSGASTTITRTYAATEVTGSSNTGGLLGSEVGTTTDSYYDQDVSGQTGGAGTAQSTADMKDLGTYLNWAMVSSASPSGPSAQAWGISSSRNYGYPFLWWWDGPACGPVPDLIGGEVHQVSTVAHLKAVGSGGPGSRECGLGATYQQVNDIDVSGESSWTGIGTSTAPFTGYYYGNFKTITGGQVWGPSFLGFFAHVGADGTVSRLGVTNIRVADPEGQGRSFRGLLVGQNAGTVSDSFATGSISSEASFMGGLVGKNDGTIKTSFASATISGSGFASYIGGLVGIVDNDAIVVDSYATGSVSGNSFVGGLVGSSAGTITRTYAVTQVSASGGFAGGLIGLSPEPGPAASYYDQTVSGQSGGVGTARASEGMRTASLYDSQWTIVENGSPDPGALENWGMKPSINSGYPYLWWQAVMEKQSAFCPILEDSVRPIRTAQELASVGSGGVGGPCGLNETYELKNDIDLSGFGNWYPIGVRNGSDVSLGFTGTFVGGGNAISFLALDSRDANFQGLFGYIRSAGTVSGVVLRSPTVSANDYVGALAGWSEGTITQSEVSGFGSVTGDNWAGGLAGQIAGSSASLSRSYSTIRAVGRSGSARIGGLVGQLEVAGAEIIDSFATGRASGSSQVGGLVGTVTGGTIRSSYSTGMVSGNLNTNGLVGLLPTDSSRYTITNSFYDVDLSAGASGPTDHRRTAAQLRDIDTFVGWDIAQTESPTGPSSQIWGISENKNSGYPFLWWSDYQYFCEPVEPPRVVTGQPNSASNPYRVLTPGHLRWIAGEDLNLVASGGTVRAADADTTSRIANRMSFVYRQDIDILQGNCGWLPIGLVLSDQNVEYPFVGSYDGNSHEIAGLNLVGASTGYMSGVISYLGFFGRLDGEVKDLTITGAILDASAGNTITLAGILAGEAWTGAKISDVSVQGALSGVEDYAGGLIGQVRRVGSGTDQTSLVRCSADVVIAAETSADGFHLGGLVGSLDEIPNTITLNNTTQLWEVDESFTEIDDCSVTAEIRATDHRGYVGGMVGRLVSDGIDQTSGRPATGRVMITDSISRGEISLTVLGGSSSYAGGAVGLGSPVMLDVELHDVTITTTGTPGYAGGLVGQLESRGLVDDSFVTGSIATAGAGAGSVGGLVGTMSSGTNVEDSSATMTINASQSGGDLTIGGLIGFQDEDATVRTSYSTGTLEVEDPRGTTTSIGGLTGRLRDGGVIQNSWTDVSLLLDTFDGNSRAAYVGGLVGDMNAPDAEITNSYAAGAPTVQGATQNAHAGQLLGRRSSASNNVGTITGGIHSDLSDTASVGIGVATGITAAAEAQMHDRAFFVGQGWPIVAASSTNLPSGSSTEVWGIVDGAACSPFLSWQASAKVQSCVAPVSSSDVSSPSAPSTDPLPQAVLPGRRTLGDPVQDLRQESAVQSPPSSSAESDSEIQDIVTGSQSPAPLESGGSGIGWLAVLALAGLGGVVFLGAGLAWWGARVR